jgi:predicted dehydrogenase
VTGSKGTAIWDGNNKPYFEQIIASAEQRFMNESQRLEPNFKWNGREGHFGCLDEMFAALIEGRKAETDCNDNIKSMAMVFGAIESSREGEKINIKI